MDGRARHSIQLEYETLKVKEMHESQEANYRIEGTNTDARQSKTNPETKRHGPCNRRHMVVARGR